MPIVNNRSFLFACLLLAIALSIRAERNESNFMDSSSAVFINDATIDSPITISVRSHLPAGTTLKIILSAKISSFAGGRFEILNTGRTVIDQNGRWQYAIRPSQDMPFLAEAYKLEFGAEAKNTSCYFVSIVSPVACKQRQQEIHSLHQTITDIWSLDKELTDFINNIEDIKQGKTGWERKIQEAIGLYSNPEEAMALAIKKWREWEPDYTRKLEIISDSLQARPSLANFISIQEQLSYLSGCLYEKYAQYRFQLLGSPRKIAYNQTGSGLLNPTDNKNNILTMMEKEIVSKMFQDTLSLMEYVDGNCISSAPDKSQWPKIRNESIRLCTTLKNEMEYYYRMGLFYRAPNKHFLKESQDLTDLIDTLSLLLNKLNTPEDKIRNTAVTSAANPEEIQTLLASLHNKITALSAEIY
ncbi:MAG: hypothetical protein HZA49_07340 [Planctomycetes bacterium]|nr:hypothetical protein [Planctomycetota bacterium]